MLQKKIISALYFLTFFCTTHDLFVGVIYSQLFSNQDSYW